MTLNFFNILTIISVFLGCLLSVFFFVTPKGERSQNRILSALLAVFCLQIFYSFVTSSYAFQYFLGGHKVLFLIRQTSFLIGPLVYFYVLSFLNKEKITAPIQWIHFAPFFLVCLFLLLNYPRMDHFVIWESRLDLYDTIAILTSNCIYLLFSFLSIRIGKGDPTTWLEILKSSTPQSWTKILLLGFILDWLVNLNSFALYMILRNPGWCAYTASIYALTAFLFMSLVTLYLLLKPDIYFIIFKYKNALLNGEEKERYLLRLEQYMRENKPYLDPDISLESLSGKVSIPPRILSRIINETYKKNFKGYILEYRLRESMKLLEDPEKRKLTILEILYQVGFNSKSAFNNQFKLYTALTPQEYRSRTLGEV